jgi:hypothetical protein
MPGKSKKGGGLETKKYAFKMEDLSGDGKVTQKDVLIGKGVLNKDGSKAKPANEMKGYQMNYKMVNKEGFKMAGNPAMKFDPDKDPNLSLITDPNLSGLDDLPGTGDNLNYEGENMNVVGVDVNKIFKPETIYTPPTRTAEGDAWYASLTPEKRAFYDNKYIKENTKPTGNKTLDSFNAVVNLASIPQPGTPEVKGDAFTSYDRRQEGRQGKIVTGQSIRNENKIRRAENRIEKLNRKSKNTGLDSKDIFGNKNFVKKQLKLQDKIDKTNIRKKNLQERQEFINTSKSNFKKQQEQGINPDVGKKGRVTLQAGTPGSSTTKALPNVKEIFQSDKVKIQKNKLAAGAGNGMKPMQLSPKAMNYFNKKNK